MTITERAALKGLRLRCIDELAKGNRRMATEEEYTNIFVRLTQADVMMGMFATKDMRERPLFDWLREWLDDSPGGWAFHYPNLITGIAIDILNKEEELS